MNYLGYSIASAGGGGGGGSDLTDVKSNIDPNITDTYDIGRSTKRWRTGEFRTLKANEYIVNGGTSQQYLMGDGSLTTGGGTTDLTEVKTDIDPDITDTRDIGSATKRWRTGEFRTLKANEYIVNGGTSDQYLMGDGSLLQYSANSGNSNFYLYTSSQQDFPPISGGEIKYNATFQSVATEIFISNLTRDNINIDIFFKQISTSTEVYIQDQNSSTNFIIYNVLAVPVVQPNTFVTISVSTRQYGGTGQTSFPEGAPVLLSFFTNGIEVDTRLTALETQTTALQTKTQFIDIVPNAMSITANIFAVKSLHSVLDLNPLSIGANSSSVDITAPILNTTKILPSADNTHDLGSISNHFRTGYFGTALRCPVYDTASFVPLQIAPTNANAVNIGRGGITSTILGTTSINSVYTLPSTAPAVGDVLTCSALGVSNWVTPTPTTTPLSSFSNYQLNFSQAGTVTSQNGFLPATAITAIGGTTTATAPTNTSTRTKIFKVSNPTLSVADGQRSGYISSLTVNTWPIFFGRTGIILNIASGIGDTNITTNAVAQMFQGLTSISTAPSFSSTLGPNTTPSIIGWGHDLGDSVISFYFRGTAGGVKIATSFSTSTPSPYWFNFNISNDCNSNLFILTLTDIISGLTATQNFTMAIGNTAVMSPQDRLFLLSCRGMAVAGGTTNSAISQFSRFGLSLE